MAGEGEGFGARESWSRGSRRHDSYCGKTSEAAKKNRPNTHKAKAHLFATRSDADVGTRTSKTEIKGLGRAHQLVLTGGKAVQDGSFF
jgi:hypothetical protein